MNERINGIVEKAGFHWNGVFAKTITLTEEDVGKFAELIVREALTKIDEVGYKSSNNISADDTELFKSVLKRHFGVEE